MAEIFSSKFYDERSSRINRLKNDKFALIDSCKKCYNPNFDLAVDEQLIPCKCRCRFLQFIKNKADIYGIKFWMLVDSSSKYVWNALPYLGKDESRPSSTPYIQHILSQIIRGLEEKGPVSYTHLTLPTIYSV